MVNKKELIYTSVKLNKWVQRLMYTLQTKEEHMPDGNQPLYESIDAELDVAIELVKKNVDTVDDCY